MLILKKAGEQMTFKKWLRQYLLQQSPIGDLARDNEQDPSFPDSYSYMKNRDYLERQHASRLCMESFEDAWRRYKNRQKKGK